jgi:Spy/CpxP family protein refolding chaperone
LSIEPIFEDVLVCFESLFDLHFVTQKEPLMYGFIYGVFILISAPAFVLAQASHSPYIGHEKRTIKNFSEEEIQALLSGQGMGLAKAAELNHYPGPRHVLDLGARLPLSEAQRAETQRIYDRMHQEAVRLGALIVDKEKELDQLFATQVAQSDTLRSLTTQLAQLQGELRFVHLQAHVEMKRLLSPEQVEAYDSLRGYTAGAGAAPHTGHHHHH